MRGAVDRVTMSRSTGGSAPTTAGTFRPTRARPVRQRAGCRAGQRDDRCGSRAEMSCTACTARPRRRRRGRRRSREPVAGAVDRRARRAGRGRGGSRSTLACCGSTASPCSCLPRRRRVGGRGPTSRDRCVERRRADRPVEARSKVRSSSRCCFRCRTARVCASRSATWPPPSPARAVLDARDLPDADVVARGWERQLDRGLQARAPAAVRRASSTRLAPTCCSHPHAIPRLSPRSKTGASTTKPPPVGPALGSGARRRRARRVYDTGSVAGGCASRRGRSDPARFLSALRARSCASEPGGSTSCPVSRRIGSASRSLSTRCRCAGLAVVRGALARRRRPGAVVGRAGGRRAPRAGARSDVVVAGEPAGETLLAEPPASLAPDGDA